MQRARLVVHDPVTAFCRNTIRSGVRGFLNQVRDSLLNIILFHDEYMLLADYQAYVDCQDRVSRAFRDEERWTRMSILNVARIGKFSSDRSIKEYCEDIWYVEPVRIELNDGSAP